MTTVRDAMIVAGGAGTRLRPVTDTTPKPLLPFCGAPFLLGVVRRLATAGIDRVLLVVGADTTPFEPLADAAARFGVTVETVPEPEPLDTAGGVRSALDRVRGTFLVLNGDILTDVDVTAAVAAHRAAAADATLVLTRVEDTSSFGVCVREGSRIVGFVEKPAPGQLPGQDAINAGTYVLEPAALAGFPQGRLSFERDVFPVLAGDGHVEGFVGDGVWADLGTPARYLDGHRLALDGALSWPTLDDVPADGAGVRSQDGVRVAAGATVVGPTLLLAGTRIAPGARVGPYTVAGRNVAIGEDARVEGSVLFDGVRIDAGAAVTRVVAGHAARVGTRAMLGDEVVLGDGAIVAPDAALAAGTRVPTP